MRFGEACAKHLVEMGRGAQEASSLGVRPPYLRTLQPLARTMNAVAGAYGFDKVMSHPTVVCTVCESHRRGVLARGIWLCTLQTAQFPRLFMVRCVDDTYDMFSDASSFCQEALGLNSCKAIERSQMPADIKEGCSGARFKDDLMPSFTP